MSGAIVEIDLDVEALRIEEGADGVEAGRPGTEYRHPEGSLLTAQRGVRA